MQVCGLKWSPDDRELASGGNDNQLFIWGGNTTSPMIRFSDHQAAVKAIAWSPHQHGLVASGGGTADRCIRFWNTATGSPLNCIDTGQHTFPPSGSQKEFLSRLLRPISDKAKGLPMVGYHSKLLGPGCFEGKGTGSLSGEKLTCT